MQGLNEKNAVSIVNTIEARLTGYCNEDGRILVGERSNDDLADSHLQLYFKILGIRIS